MPLTLGPILLRAHTSGALTKLWTRLPPMKSIALPLDFEEQEALLGRTDVVRAEVAWSGPGSGSRQRDAARVVMLGEEPGGFSYNSSRSSASQSPPAAGTDFSSADAMEGGGSGSYTRNRQGSGSSTGSGTGTNTGTGTSSGIGTVVATATARGLRTPFGDTGGSPDDDRTMSKLGAVVGGASAFSTVSGSATKATGSKGKGKGSKSKKRSSTGADPSTVGESADDQGADDTAVQEDIL